MLTSLKTELKQNFSDLKNGIQKEKWFLIALSVLTILFVTSIFAEAMIYVAIMFIVFMAIFFDFEKAMGLTLFLYPFYGLFSITLNGAYRSLYSFACYAIIGICLIKYLINVYKGKQKFNLKLYKYLFFLLLYLALPIHNLAINSFFKYIVAFVVFYLLFEQKNKIDLKNIVLWAVIGLLLSCFMSFLSPLSPRLSEVLGYYSNYGLLKFQGLTTNPNIYASIVAIVLPALFYFCTRKNGLLWFFLLIPLMAFSYFTISRNLFISMLLALAFFAILYICKKNKRGLISLGAVLLVILTISVASLNYTKAYLVRFNVLTEESIKVPDSNKNLIENPNKSDLLVSGNWIDGTPNDPGRWQLWKRYLKDYSSSPQNVIFGAGITAEKLGAQPHSFYIEFLWRFGLFGLVFAIVAIVLKFRDILKLLKNNCFLAILLNVLFISAIELIFFNYIFNYALVLLFASSRKEIEDQEALQK